MHALVVAAPGEDSAGVLVDDQYFAVGDDVVLIAGEQFLGLDRVVEVADERGVDRLVQVVDAEHVLDLVDTRLEDADVALLLVHLVVDVALEVIHRLGKRHIPLIRIALGRPRDDQRCSGLVDQDRVNLIDDGEVVTALDEVIQAHRHVVAQVIEAEFVVRAVGDVARVLFAPLRGRQAGGDRACRHAKEAVDATHELRLIGGQVVVDGHNMDALAGDRVQVGGQGCHEGLTFTGLHLRDVAQMKGSAAHDLHVVVALAERAHRGLSHGGEGFWQKVIERFTGVVARAELLGLPLELLVAHVLKDVLELVDLLCDSFQLSKNAPFASSQNLIDKFTHVCSSL